MQRAGEVERKRRLETKAYMDVPVNSAGSDAIRRHRWSGQGDEELRDVTLN